MEFQFNNNIDSEIKSSYNRWFDMVCFQPVRNHLKKVVSISESLETDYRKKTMRIIIIIIIIGIGVDLISMVVIVANFLFQFSFWFVCFQFMVVLVFVVLFFWYFVTSIRFQIKLYGIDDDVVGLWDFIFLNLIWLLIIIIDFCVNGMFNNNCFNWILITLSPSISTIRLPQTKSIDSDKISWLIIWKLKKIHNVKTKCF